MAEHQAVYATDEVAHSDTLLRFFAYFYRFLVWSSVHYPQGAG